MPIILCQFIVICPPLIIGVAIAAQSNTSEHNCTCHVRLSGAKIDVSTHDIFCLEEQNTSTPVKCPPCARKCVDKLNFSNAVKVLISELTTIGLPSSPVMVTVPGPVPTPSKCCTRAKVLYLNLVNHFVFH